MVDGILRRFEQDGPQPSASTEECVLQMSIAKLGELADHMDQVAGKGDPPASNEICRIQADMLLHTRNALAALTLLLLSPARRRR